MKKLVVTRADDNISEMCEITHPILKRYAQKCGAEFKVLSDNKGIHPHYRILQLFELFNVYDRILCIDSDILILKTCPNIFNLVNYNEIACIFEDVGSRKEDRRNRIKKIQEDRGYIGWKKGYINTGFILFSEFHKDLFDIPVNELYLDLGYDDVLLGYLIYRRNYKVKRLSYKWNHMSMFSEEWNNKESRFDSYVIHYAGTGFFRYIDRVKQIKYDSLVLEKYNLLM